MEGLDAGATMWGGDGREEPPLTIAGALCRLWDEPQAVVGGELGDRVEPLRGAPTECIPTREHKRRRRSLGKSKRAEEDSRSEKAAKTTKVGSKRKQRRLISKVWINAEPIYHDGKLVEGKCIHCHQIFPTSRCSGTSQIARHLKVCQMRPKTHNVVDNMHSLVIQPEAPILKDWRFDNEVSRKELVRMIVLHELPFSFVESDGFKSFVASLNPNFKMVSRTTVQADCIACYEAHKLALRDLLKNCNSRVSLAVDMWMSNQNLGYLCISCHFIDNEWNVQKRIIGFCLMKTPNDALNMYNAILKSIQDWHIEDKIFSLTLGDASINTAMINSLKENLVKKDLLHCQGKLFHVQCASHVLNIIVQDGLKEIDSMVDNIRNSVKYVMSSRSRKEKFEEIIAQMGVSGKHLSLDVGTQWSSTFLMLKSALPFKAAFYALGQQDLNYKCAPSSSEWKRAEDVVDLLKVFYTASKVVYGSKHPTSNHHFHELWLVKKSLENGARSRNPSIVVMVKEMQGKFDKYWKESFLTNCIPVIFDPRYKYDYIEFRLKTAFGSHAKRHLDLVNEAIRDLFYEYSTKLIDSLGRNLQGTSGDSHSEAENDPLADWDQHLSIKKVQTNNELDIYLKEELFPRREALDILQWWALQSPKFPILSHMARDVLAVPASTVVFESAFSMGRRIINDYRSGLSSDAVEALICLQDWLKAATSSHKKNPIVDIDDDEEVYI